MQNDFDDIRPYHDAEIPAVVRRLINDREMADLLLQLRYPALGTKLLRPLLRSLVRWRMQKVLGHVQTVREFQLLVGVHLESLLESHGSEVTVSGLESLSPDRAYLFISNHRDIAMDPALIDLVLDRNGHQTVRIAIGDNLLSKPFVADLMRINKSFIVKRSAQGRREKFQALTQLSHYIRYSLLTDCHPVWIAQREGRAKDGKDRTETALLKMLALSRAKEQSFGSSIAELNVVPVAISYELDPCDIRKARELHALRTVGEYRKSPYEDTESIYDGIFGEKGRIHLAFGSPLVEECSNDEVAAEVIDHQILSLYRLQVSNLVAWREMGGDPAVLRYFKDEVALDEITWQRREAVFLERVVHCPEEYRDLFLAMYANPVHGRIEAQRQAQPAVSS